MLLAEDEAPLRALVARTLREPGYQLRRAENGRAALGIIQESGAEAFDMLLTDVLMPPMGGRELADQLQTLCPGAKVPFTSGYTDDTIDSHRVLEPSICFWHQPFRPAYLAHKVREGLDGTSYH